MSAVQYILLTSPFANLHNIRTQILPSKSVQRTILLHANYQFTSGKKIFSSCLIYVLTYIPSRTETNTAQTVQV